MLLGENYITLSAQDFQIFTTLIKTVYTLEKKWHSGPNYKWLLCSSSFKWPRRPPILGHLGQL